MPTTLCWGKHFPTKAEAIVSGRKPMPARLALFEDVYRNAATASLPSGIRMLFVTHGALTVEGQEIRSGQAWSGDGAVTCGGGAEGATVWRWELSQGETATFRAADVSTRDKLSADLDTLPQGELLLRGDSVAFPPGGTALTHTHQGPGIRCMIEGAIRIDTHGRSTSYGPGGAWFETGPDPVFAQADPARASRFIRVMVLPRALLGKSSIRYDHDEDKDKPKSQKYEVFIDRAISLPGK
jgi:quercetin dioxygenase-like cupin family protein